MLVDHGVAFVVIGGVAAAAHGSPSATFGLDVCYDRAPENLDALARALQHLRARLRGAPEGLPWVPDARTLRAGHHVSLVTDLGDLDCLGTPAGTDGYQDLIRNAVDISLDEVVVKIAGLDDLIRMKRAAGRPKDRIELEVLGALREELDRAD